MSKFIFKLSGILIQISSEKYYFIMYNKKRISLIFSTGAAPYSVGMGKLIFKLSEILIQISSEKYFFIM